MTPVRRRKLKKIWEGRGSWKEGYRRRRPANNILKTPQKTSMEKQRIK